MESKFPSPSKLLNKNYDNDNISKINNNTRNNSSKMILFKSNKTNNTNNTYNSNTVDSNTFNLNTNQMPNDNVEDTVEIDNDNKENRIGNSKNTYNTGPQQFVKKETVKTIVSGINIKKNKKINAFRRINTLNSGNIKSNNKLDYVQHYLQNKVDKTNLEEMDIYSDRINPNNNMKYNLRTNKEINPFKIDIASSNANVNVNNNINNNGSLKDKSSKIIKLRQMNNNWSTNKTLKYDGNNNNNKNNSGSNHSNNMHITKTTNNSINNTQSLNSNKLLNKNNPDYFSKSINLFPSYYNNLSSQEKELLDIKPYFNRRYVSKKQNKNSLLAKFRKEINKTIDEISKCQIADKQERIKEQKLKILEKFSKFKESSLNKRSSLVSIISSENAGKSNASIRDCRYPKNGLSNKKAENKSSNSIEVSNASNQNSLNASQISHVSNESGRIILKELDLENNKYRNKSEIKASSSALIFNSNNYNDSSTIRRESNVFKKINNNNIYITAGSSNNMKESINVFRNSHITHKSNITNKTSNTDLSNTNKHNSRINSRKNTIMKSINQVDLEYSKKHNSFIMNNLKNNYDDNNENTRSNNLIHNILNNNNNSSNNSLLNPLNQSGSNLDIKSFPSFNSNKNKSSNKKSSLGTTQIKSNSLPIIQHLSSKLEARKKEKQESIQHLVNKDISEILELSSNNFSFESSPLKKQISSNYNNKTKLKKSKYYRIRTYMTKKADNFYSRKGAMNPEFQEVYSFIEFQSNTIIDELIVLQDNIQTFKLLLNKNPQYMMIFKTQDLQYKLQYNIIFEEFISMLLVISDLIMKDFKNYVEQFLHVQKISKDRLEVKEITEENECFLYNINLFKDVSSYFKGCCQGYTVLVKHVSDMILKPKTFSLLKQFLERSRLNISQLIFRMQSFINEYNNDLVDLNKFKLMKLKGELEMEIIDADHNDKERITELYKKVDTQLKVYRQSNMDLVDKIKTQFDVKRNIGYERNKNLSLLLKQIDTDDKSGVNKIISDSLKKNDYVRVENNEYNLFNNKNARSNSVDVYGINANEKGILQSREMNRILRYTPIEFRNKIISHVIIERYRDKNNEGDFD